MTCREVYEFLDEFLDHRLDVVTLLKFQSHLVLCAACQRYLATYRATVKVVSASELKNAPAETLVPEELVQAILASRAAISAEPGT